jgi:endonuclease/exonuclease/phosphatase family metal-dependent hydrolase
MLTKSQTGMSGMAGNKGAVAIRMEYANTSICFVTAHLAAGFANYEERNRDYKTISHGLRFQRNRSIEDHDTVIWLGDFNYRIGLNNEKVQKLCHVGDLETLYENDQVIQHPPNFILSLYADKVPAKPPDGRWLDLSILLRGPHHLPSHV